MLVVNVYVKSNLCFAQRKETLLQEYKLRNKNNLFLDKRIGEKEEGLPQLGGTLVPHVAAQEIEVEKETPCRERRRRCCHSSVGPLSPTWQYK